MSNDQFPHQTSSSNVKRKLAAILAADVQGYSRLMGEDEVATLYTLTAYREVTDALIAHHHGRIVNTVGDSILAEFASVVDAVQCAVEIQNQLAVKNTDLPENRRMAFRIGINLGDVMVEGEQIYGDGVNIAARLESLADGGGICVAGNVYEQVRNKLPLHYEDMGAQTVKNIAEPVRVWRIRTESSSHKSQVESQKPRRAGIVRRFWMVGGVVGVVLMVGIFGAVQKIFFFKPSPQSLTPSPQSLPLPDKPSIVVLPFTNMSDDPKQEYFSDGISEDITSALSKISSLFVIARNSAFTYKGKAVKVQEVSKDLGVRYVLEGSVRRVNDQVRITVQLIDATTGYQLWSERYDRALKDIFAVQDEIVQKIVTTLKLQLTLREQGYLMRKHTESLEAYDYLLRGMELYNRATQETHAQAQQLFEKVIALDPQYAEAYASLSRTFMSTWLFQWSQDPQTQERGFVLAQQAVALDDSLPEAHTVLAYAYLYKSQHEQAIAVAKRAIALGPNEAEGTALLGLILNFAGRPQEAIGLIQKGIRLNPRYQYNYISWLGMAYGLARRYDEAIVTLQSAIIRNPNFMFPHLHLAATYSEVDRDEEARAEADEVRRRSPSFSLERTRQNVPFKDPAELERYLAALRKAGLK